MEGSCKIIQNFLSKSTHEKADKILLQPYLHIATGEQSLIIINLLTILNYWMQLSDDDFKEACELVQMFGNTALLMDDMQDNSSLRRGRPTAHLVYGIQKTVACTWFSLSIAIEKLNRQKIIPGSLPKLIDVLMASHRGQAVEIYWRDNYICPTEEDYMEMVSMKTGSIIHGSLGLMQVGKNKLELKKFASLMGTYLQIHDDYGNLRFQEYKDRKGFCEDLTEGKFSFPIIHAINSHPEDKRVFNIVKQRTTDDEVKKRCVKILEEYGSFEYTERVLKSLEAKLIEEVERLGGNPLFDDFLKKTTIVNSKSIIQVCG